MIMISKLYYNVFWWLKDARFVSDPNFKTSSYISLDCLPKSMLRENGIFTTIVDDIHKSLHLPEDSQIVVWPYHLEKGPIPRNVSFWELMKGHYGSISKERPLQFLVVGPWSFDGNGRDLISRIEGLEDSRSILWDGYRQWLRCCQLTNSVTSRDESEGSSSIAPPVYEEQLDTYSERERYPTIPYLGVVEDDVFGFLDLPPPYSELPEESIGGPMAYEGHILTEASGVDIPIPEAPMTPLSASSTPFLESVPQPESQDLLDGCHGVRLPGAYV
jgi:hypothetical protein